jgi:hypothetical protein
VLRPQDAGCDLASITKDSPLRDLLGGRAVTLIDDTHHTGSTITRVRGQFSRLPQFPEVAGERFVVHAPK